LSRSSISFLPVGVIIRILRLGRSDEGLVVFQDTDSVYPKKKGFSFISKRHRRGKETHIVRRGEVGFEPKTFG
jgi:hypothetical protein